MNKNFWRGLYLLNWTVILGFWFFSARELLQLDIYTGIYAIGRLLGLSAVYMVLTQFFLISRLPTLENSFGLDKLTRLHHKYGQRAIFLLLLHPVFLIIGHMKAEGVGFWHQFFLYITQYDDVLNAVIGLILFIIVVGTSIYIVSKHLRYESWYFVHLFVYLAVMFSFGHQFEIGSTISGSQIFYLYWGALYLVVLGIHVFFRFLRPVYLFNKHQFKIEKIVRENNAVVSVYITGNNISEFNIKPGQFMIFRFLSKKTWWQAHPFSLSAMPDGKHLRITIKGVGDFTKDVPNLLPGTLVIIEGPYGVFTDFFGISKKVLFLAGGIGITPVRTLFEDNLIKGRDAKLIYANRKEEDVVFRGELDSLQNKYKTEVVHVFSDKESNAEEKGYIDEEKIKRLVPDVLERDVYVCGPIPMMDSIIDILKRMGVPENKIHFEKFALLG